VWAGTGSADDSVPAGGCNGYGSGAMVVHRSGPMPHDPGTLDRRQLPKPDGNPVWPDSQGRAWTSYPRPAGQATRRMPPRASMRRPRAAR